MIVRKMLRQIFHQFKRLGLAVAVDRGDDKERLGKWRQVVFKPFPAPMPSSLARPLPAGMSRSVGVMPPNPPVKDYRCPFEIMCDYMALLPDCGALLRAISLPSAKLRLRP